MNANRSIAFALIAALAAAFAPAAQAQGSAAQSYQALKSEYSVAIDKAGTSKASQKRVNLDYAKKFADLGSRDRGEIGSYSLLQAASLAKEANDPKTAERYIGDARKRGGSWEVKMTILQVAYKTPNQMSLCRDIAQDYLPEAKKDPKKARDLASYLREFGMEKEAAALEGAAPAKQKKAKAESGGSGGAERNEQGMQLSKASLARAKAFSGKDRLSGKTISLASLKGKVVVLDFWATWCGPCVAEMPNVKKLYKKHKSSGMELIGISLDSNLDALDQFVKSEGMEWPQLADGKGWKSSIGQLYGVNSIPHTVVIDREGNVVAEDLRGSALDKAVQEALR